MSYELTGASALSDEPCRYGKSKLLVRGPRRDLDTPYLAFMGGTEVYGRFVPRPFVARLEESLERTCVNLGSVNAGLDSFVNDEELKSVARGADITVLQVLGAQNISNRLYRVHPRRNDRFLQASESLNELYDDVDFTEYHFNKHLLTGLESCSPERFALVRAELETAWVARMRKLIEELDGQVVLLWLRYDLDKGANSSLLDQEPTLVESGMIDALRSQVMGVIEVPVQTAGGADDIDGMVLGQMDLPTANHMIGPLEHMRIANAAAEGIRQALAAS
ncbi:hypothetical protein A9Q94_08180 [Rhodobacterales bacterium 56_14_T64]|nr:hypothetical protein A9Q94_08180 [Rhodobacterales bacterium 56_14_T64]